MTAIAILLAIVLAGLILNYKRAQSAFKKSIKLSQAARESYDKSMVAMEKHLTAQNNLVEALTQEYETVSKRAIQLRLTLMEIDMPNFRSSSRVLYAIDDLKNKYMRKEIDAFTYYSEVNTTLDMVSTKNYN